MKAKTLLLPRFAPTTFLVLLIWASLASGATEKILYNFNAYPHGSQPTANLIADASGNLYGTTFIGGAHEFGAVFKLTPNSKGGWTETVLYSFKGLTDGQNPYGGLIFDSAGNLYGTTYNGGTGPCNGNNYGCGTVFKLAPNSHGAWNENVLYTFQGGSDGALPDAGLVLDSAGNLYGTTTSGGTGQSSNCSAGACGTVFKLAPKTHGGWTESILYNFTGGSDGAIPRAGLTLDSAGNLYGTATVDGSISTTCRQGCGTVFKLTPSSSTWTLSVLYTFAGGATDGSGPSSGLIFDNAGNLYGTTIAGGSGFCQWGCGTAFELTSNGSGGFTESVLHSFKGGTSDGSSPQTGLIFDQAGNLYGSTQTGGKTKGVNGAGIIFQLAPGTGGQWSEKILHVFAGGSDGANPSSGGALVLDQANNLYGTSFAGGAVNAGMAFRLTPTTNGSWTKSTIYSFTTTDGQYPTGSLTMDAAGNLYGTTFVGGTYGQGEVFQLAPNSTGGWAKSTIYNFVGTSDGSSPSDLVSDTAGNLYGLSHGFSDRNLGTIFELKPNGNGTWTESTLYTFTTSVNGTSDGYDAFGLTLDASGNLYGVTVYGGAYAGGTVYELANNGNGVWTHSVLYSFAFGADGDYPYAGLIFDGAGNLYGTTPVGGTLTYFGVVFELSPSSGGGWTESVLYNFAGGSDGSGPMAPLTFDPAGNLYGTTTQGGIPGCNCGTLFTLSHSSGGWTESVLHSFTGGSDGGSYFDSMPGLVIDGAGNLYGATISGGNTTCNYALGYRVGCGVVYMLAPGSDGQWTESVLHSFTGYPTDGGGGEPIYYYGNSLVRDAAGNLYGVTGGGSANDGVIFEVTP